MKPSFFNLGVVGVGDGAPLVVVALQPIFQLIPVEVGVDQPVVQRLTCVEQRVLHQRDDGVLIHAAMGLHDLEQVVPALVEQPLAILPGGVRHVLAQHHLRRRFVVLDLVHVRFDAQLVEGAAEMHRAGRQAGELDVGAGRGDDLVAGGEYAVGAHVESVRVAENRLSCGAYLLEA